MRAVYSKVKLQFMVFNCQYFSISWESVLLVEETGVPGEKTTDLSQITDKFDHIMLYPVR